MQTTAGHLLGGRLRYAQPLEGYRTGIEPVLLAAAVPAQPGERVLEGGTGAGAGLLCLAARVPGVTGLGIEIDPAMAALARHNVAANGLTGLDILTGDLLALALSGFDHAFANPPWHDPGSTPSPVARRRLAKQAEAGGLPAWTEALVGAVRPGGTVTLITPDGAADSALDALAGLGERRRVRLLPKEGRKAKLALVSARKSPASADVTEAELVLHEADGRYRPEIEAVLRSGGALPDAVRTASCPAHTR